MKASMRGIVLAACFAAWLAPTAWAGPREDVNAAIDQFLAARSFHADILITGAVTQRRRLEFVAPGRYRMRGEDAAEQVVIGDVLFVAVDGKPSATAITDDTLLQWRDPVRLAQNAADMTVTALGEETLGEQPARKFRIDHPPPQAGMVTLWIGTDGYPLQVASDGELQGQAVTTTIRYSRYNDPAIRIDPPR
ncbi:outer membrane lipoprotein carrier protein LolA [Lysobacter koreensis]|uniref:Outer membrane lipoprotein carrier protein LolA n=1 Tax=Lysobacter koreensis TaxID=266122 RepID=A0ABW2YLA1_9GAMM